MSLRENLWRAAVSRIELREPLILSPCMPVRRVVHAMRQEGIGCCLLCDNGQLAGMFTERDLIKRVLVPRIDIELPVSTVMSTPVATLQPDDTVGFAIRRMYQGGYRRLPVVDANGFPIGLVSVKRLIRYLADHFPSTVYNLPPQPRQIQQAREGA